MSQSDKFFQFPIGALRFKKKITEVSHSEMAGRLTQVMEYCVLTEGKKLRDKDGDQAETIAERVAAMHDLEYETEEDIVLLAGCGILNVVPGGLNYKYWHQQWKAINELSTSGGNQHVRIKANIVWEAIKDESGQIWTWRDFATLAAVYSAVGSYKMSRTTYDRIGSLAIGYSGQKSRDAAKAKKYQLTDRQTQYTVKRLEDRGFFVSASPNFRHMYYSNRISKEELIKALVEQGRNEKRSTAKSITELIREQVERY